MTGCQSSVIGYRLSVIGHRSSVLVTERERKARKSPRNLALRSYSLSGAGSLVTLPAGGVLCLRN